MIHASICNRSKTVSSIKSFRLCGKLSKNCDSRCIIFLSRPRRVQFSRYKIIVVTVLAHGVYDSSPRDIPADCSLSLSLHSHAGSDGRNRRRVLRERRRAPHGSVMGNWKIIVPLFSVDRPLEIRDNKRGRALISRRAVV